MELLSEIREGIVILDRADFDQSWQHLAILRYRHATNRSPLH